MAHLADILPIVDIFVLVATICIKFDTIRYLCLRFMVSDYYIIYARMKLYKR